MKLLFDCIPYDRGKSGISVYVRELAAALIAEGHALTLLLEPDSPFREERPELPCIVAPRWTRRPALSMLWHLFILPFRLRRMRDDFDGFVITAANRRACAWYPIPTTATVHDLANFHIPGKYSRLRMLYLARILPHYAKKATHLVAVSASTAKDMELFWHVKPGRTTVLYNGLTPMPRPSPGRPSWLEANGLRKGGYILYISRIEHPGKNHVKLIDAFAALGRNDLVLVLAGSDWKDAETVHAHAAASTAADRIKFTGFIDREDLAEAYANCALYVFPSRFEGFGLSLVEAMSEGAPVACSGNGALGEVGGDAAEKFPPDDADAMSAAMSRVLSETAGERSARLARGRARAAEFSWRTHAEGIAALLEPPGFVDMFGIRVRRTTYDETIDLIVKWAKEGVRPTKIVATLNVDFVTNAVPLKGFKSSPELLECLRGADFVTADGMPIVLLARMLGCRLGGRVTGADIVPMMAGRFAEEGLSIYVLGGAEEPTAKALEILKAANPGLKVAGTDHSLLDLGDPASVDASVARVNAAKPDCLLLALGNPKQELWAARNAHRLDVPVLMGIGGTFNFIAGAVKRAPVWMQRCGLEWIWRVMQEPRRLWRRYAVGLVKFSLLSCRELWRSRAGTGGGNDSMEKSQ